MSETLKAVRDAAKLTCELVIDGCERDMERVAERIRAEALDLRKTAEGMSSHGERVLMREHADKLSEIANFADSWSEPEREPSAHEVGDEGGAAR